MKKKEKMHSCQAKKPSLFKWFFISIGILLLLIGGIVTTIVINKPRLTNNTLLRDTVSYMLNKTAERLGYDLTVSSLIMDDLHELKVNNVKVGDFFLIEKASIKWTFKGLLRREIEEIRVYGSKLWLSKLEAEQKRRRQNSKKTGKEVSDKETHVNKSENKEDRGLNILVKKLIIGDTQVYVDNISKQMPPIPLFLGNLEPLVFEDITFGSKSDSQIDELIEYKITDFSIYSPYDPFTKVLHFPSIIIAFSWQGLQNNQIDLLGINQPEIYIGSDLFWLIDAIQAEEVQEKSNQEDFDALSTKKNSTPWTLGTFEVNGGKLILTTFGKPGIVLPLVFSCQTSGIVSDSLTDIHLGTRFKIDPINLNYDDYNLKVMGLRGDLEFSLPPQKADADNIVPTIEIESLIWKGIEAKNNSLSVTFDSEGIYGKHYSELPNGFMESEFYLLLKEGFPWEAWAFTYDIDIKPITTMLSPEDFLMDGKIDSEFHVVGKRKVIKKLEGKITLDKPGTLSIKSIDSVLQKLPQEWSSIKRDMATIALEAMRDYDYKDGDCTFNYEPPLSTLNLSLDGLQGKRSFDIRWHEHEVKPKKSASVAIKTKIDK